MAQYRNTYWRHFLADNHIEVNIMPTFFENLKNLFYSQPEKRDKPIKEGFIADQGGLWGPNLLWTDYYNRSVATPFGYNSFSPIANTSDRLNGFDFPYTYSLADHFTYIANSRYVAKTNPYAIGLINGLSAYVLGANGITFTVSSDDDDLTKEVDDLLKMWWQKTNFDTLQVELYQRSIIDGEYFLRKFPQRDGFLKLRTIEPEHIKIPDGYDPLSASMGVVCEPDDPQTVLGYGVYIYRGSQETSGIEFIDVSEIIHDKKGVTQSMKRGQPSFTFDTGVAFMNAAKLARNITQLSTIQSSVAFIRQHASATASQVQDFIDSQNTNASPPYPQWASPSSFAGNGYYATGTILDMPKSLEYKDPPSAGNIDRYIEALNMALRECGRKWNVPEWLISGKGDSINFASSLTTESPFLRSVLKEQKDFKETVQKIMTAVVQNFAIADLIPLNYKERNLKIELVTPSVETREYKKEAELNKMYLEMGIKSPQTIAGEIGLNYEREQENFAALRDRQQEKDSNL